jgi:predicted transcriptional regulator
MVSYLCDVKTDLRSRKQAVEGLQKEKTALQDEKAELIKKIEEQRLAQKKETQRSVKVEVELRDHCTKAHEAYTRMVE